MNVSHFIFGLFITNNKKKNDNILVYLFYFFSYLLFKNVFLMKIISFNYIFMLIYLNMNLNYLIIFIIDLHIYGLELYCKNLHAYFHLMIKLILINLFVIFYLI